MRVRTKKWAQEMWVEDSPGEKKIDGGESGAEGEFHYGSLKIGW